MKRLLEACQCYLRFELCLEDVCGELVGELLLAELDGGRDDFDDAETGDFVAVEEHVSAQSASENFCDAQSRRLRSSTNRK